MRLIVAIVVCLVGASCAAGAAWKAGMARAQITPAKPLWMAGYGGRTKPAEGKLHELWIRVLALEDAAGRRGVVLSSDTLGFPRAVYNDVLERVDRDYGLSASQVMLNASHTHCGPVLTGALYDAYPLNDSHRKAIAAYSDSFVNSVVETIGRALKDLRPARVYRGVGRATFAVNRRNNREADVPRLRAAKMLRGPLDHSVPVLAVRSGDGKLRAVVFAYACHNTTLSFYQWCGDYAGFAQDALEKKHPSAAAMFVMGCGGDQNPLPRRKVELARAYGERLAAAVDRVLSAKMTELSPQLQTRIAAVELKFGAAPTRDELAKLAAGRPNYRQRWASRLLKQIESGTPFDRGYRYPLQAWRLGGEQLWIAMAGEVVVDYAIKFRDVFGSETWVTAYANDVMAYIPSKRVLKEGGYEGQSSMMVYGLPAHRWDEGVEDRLTAAARKLVTGLGRTR